jgi:quercetin dioxygenase-like cupin family protein
MLIRGWNRKKAKLVHEGTVLAQTLFSRVDLDSGVMGGWASLEAGKEIEPHSHPEKEIYFILKGEGRIKTEGEASQIGEEDAVYIPPNAVHSLQNEGEENLEFIWVSFDHQPLPHLTRLLSYVGRRILGKVF